MFTGIITDLGQVLETRGHGDLRLRIATHYPVQDIDLGASVCCNGACLTVVAKGVAQNHLDFDVSAETQSRTTISQWRTGTKVNLERALRVGDELGGHIVSGHVDGIAVIEDRRPDGQSMRFTLRAPDALASFVAEKGSIALDGVSLTVNEVEGAHFGVNIIPHTRAVTGIDDWQPGTAVNLEVDMMARYVARLVRT